MIMEFGGGVMHFGISEGGGGVKIWKPSIVRYSYFLELPSYLFDSVRPMVTIVFHL